MLTLTPLASGSKGNATLLSWNDRYHALIDCGIGIRAIEKKLAEQGLEPTQLCALIVTHEHGDHIAGVGPLARKYNLPVYLSQGTAKVSGKTLKLGKAQTHIFCIHTPFSLEGGLTCTPFPVPHDARENCAFTFKLDGLSEQMGYLTDCGHITPHIITMLQEVSALAIEANHCPEMLRKGPYPAALKQRVGGFYGHLANEQTAELLRVLRDNLKSVRLMHLSEQNNSPKKALDICKASLNDDTEIIAASQEICVSPLILG